MAIFKSNCSRTKPKVSIDVVDHINKVMSHTGLGLYCHLSSLEDARMRFRNSSTGLASHMSILPFAQSSVGDSRLFCHESFCAWKGTRRMILRCLSFKRSSNFSLLRSAMLLLSTIQFIPLYVLCAFLYTISPLISPGADLMAKKIAGHVPGS